MKSKNERFLQLLTLPLLGTSHALKQMPSHYDIIEHAWANQSPHLPPNSNPTRLINSRIHQHTPTRPLNNLYLAYLNGRKLRRRRTYPEAREIEVGHV
jgi:hypothetical protein